MKKMSLVCMMMFLLGMAIFPVFAETTLGDEQIEYGDFEFNTASEIRLPDPVFGNTYGVAQGWGSLSFDSAAMAVIDPDDAENTVLKLSYTDDAQAWSSFFRFLTFTPSSTYDVSIDFKIVGTTNNIGFRFAGPAAGPEVQLLTHASKTAISEKEGWFNVAFTYDSGVANYDSIALWFNTGSSLENYALLDNISVTLSDTNINIGGDFEGFLDYAPQALLSEDSANAYGFFGTNGSVGNGNAVLSDNGYFGKEVIIPSGTYQVAFDFELSDVTGTNLDVEIFNATEAIETVSLIEAGVLDLDVVTEAEGVYSALLEVTLVEAGSDIRIAYSGSVDLTVDNLSLVEVITIPDNPFDPDTTYYESDNLILNGDFEAFAVDTIFSESQLEGAWGSVALDGPAKIKSIDDSKVMVLEKASGKTYSSAFVITPPELDVDDLLRVTYDYKLNVGSELSSFTAINTSFVGISNTSYYTIDLKTLTDGSLSEGAELLHMPIQVTDLENGWARVSIDLQVDAELLIKCNSIRFLFTPILSTDQLLIDNVSMYYLTDVAPVIDVASVNIPEGDQELDVAEEVQLSVDILPTNADDQSVVWSSTNSAVATVDQMGKVNAVGAGACSIKVETTDGSVSDTIVVTVFSAAVETTEPNTGMLVGLISGGVLFIAGLAFVILKFRKPRV